MKSNITFQFRGGAQVWLSLFEIYETLALTNTHKHKPTAWGGDETDD